MIARCLEAQWHGLPAFIREIIRDQWHMNQPPGSMGTMSEAMTNIWYILENEKQTYPIPGHALISIKYSPSDREIAIRLKSR